MIDVGAFAYTAAPVTVPAGEVFATLTMDTEVVDTDGIFAPGGSGLIVPHDGYYFAWGVPSLLNPGFDVIGRLIVNGISVGFEPQVSGFTTIGYQGPTCFWIGPRVAGDVIASQIWGRNNDSPPGGPWQAKTQMGLIEVGPDHCLLSSVTPMPASPAAYAKLTFSTVQSDPAGMAGTNRIVFAKAGYYLVLSNVDRGGTRTEIRKNGAAGPLRGSHGEAPSEYSRMDFAVAWMEVGDYVEMYGGYDGAVGKRLFGAIRLGGAGASVAYVYPTANHSNSEAPGGAPNQNMYPRIDFDGEWIDTEDAHPFVVTGSYADSVFARDRIGLAPGISFVAAKLNAQGYFTGNSAIQIRKKDVDAYPYVATSRGGSDPNVATQFALIPAVAGDWVGFIATMSDSGVRNYYGTYTSAYVGDVEGPPAPAVSMNLGIPL